MLFAWDLNDNLKSNSTPRLLQLTITVTVSLPILCNYRLPGFAFCMFFSQPPHGASLGKKQKSSSRSPVQFEFGGWADQRIVIICNLNFSAYFRQNFSETKTLSKKVEKAAPHCTPMLVLNVSFFIGRLRCLTGVYYKSPI